MRIFYVHIDDLKNKALLTDYLKTLPTAIGEEILRYKQEKDRWRVLGGKLLVQHLVKQNNYPFSLSDLQKTKKGKLFFEDAKFDFNLSHSGNLVVLTSIEGGSCGIDIELHRQIDIELFERNFTTEEWSTILSAKNSNQQFFDYWSIKESVIKADGRGFEVLEKTAIQSNQLALCEDKKWHLIPFFMAKGYSACVAVDKEIKVVEIERYKSTLY